MSEPAIEDSYFTIARSSSAETKVKASRFIAEVFLIADVDEALERLSVIRKREYTANHHCYAYIVGRGNEMQFKYSDDGEPGGTAGKPIYDVVNGTGVTNVLCVVTRYFGGTKLGTGGLVRAYGEAARAAMDLAGTRENYLTSDYRFSLEFSLYDRWLRAVQGVGAEVIDAEFTDTVAMRVRVRQSLAARLVATFVELSSGKGKVEEITSED